MLTCKQIAWVVSSGQLDDAGWLLRLSARLHFFMCRHCRRYKTQISATRTMARKGFGSAPDDTARLSRLEGELLSRIAESDADPPGPSK